MEAVDVRMWVGIEIMERAGGDQRFATAFAGGEKEWNVRDLLGENVDGAIDPNDLLIGIGERDARVVDVVAFQKVSHCW